jgi:branched-chain amino acid transport system ATP-binding protein
VGIVRAINADGTTVIWIEHVVRALTEMVSRLICLADGTFVGDGTPAEVLANPRVRELYFGTDVSTSLADGTRADGQQGAEEERSGT